MMTWILLHPNVTPEHLGEIPHMLSENDPRPAREQFDERYAHGGGWRPISGPGGGFTMSENLVLKYPDDPPLEPLAQLQFRDELIVFYDHALVMIKQADGTFEVSRMD